MKEESGKEEDWRRKGNCKDETADKDKRRAARGFAIVIESELRGYIMFYISMMVGFIVAHYVRCNVSTEGKMAAEVITSQF